MKTFSDPFFNDYTGEWEIAEFDENGNTIDILPVE